jgi:Holliday junction resolvase RusA-like endonuclease
MGAVRMTQRSKWKDEHAQKYLSYKDAIGFAAKQHIKEPLNKPISVKLAFYYPMPKKWSKSKKDDANDQGIMPVVKPDIDNCIKGVFDALNKIAWTDDNLVVDVWSMKRYSHKPMIAVTIEEVIA